MGERSYTRGSTISVLESAMCCMDGGREWSYLACAHLVKGDKGKCLREHGGGEILFGRHEGDQDAREEQLGEEGHRFDPQSGEVRKGRGEIELGVVGAEVVAVVDAGDMVEECFLDEGGSVARFNIWVVRRVGTNRACMRAYGEWGMGLQFEHNHVEPQESRRTDNG